MVGRVWGGRGEVRREDERSEGVGEVKNTMREGRRDEQVKTGRKGKDMKVNNEEREGRGEVRREEEISKALGQVKI